MKMNLERKCNHVMMWKLRNKFPCHISCHKRLHDSDDLFLGLLGIYKRFTNGCKKTEVNAQSF